MISRLKKISCLFAVVFLTVFCFVPSAAKAQSSEDDGEVLKVAFPENTGISEIYEYGTYGGAVYDWLHEIAKYTGWKYEFITGSANDLLKGMADGEYDLMGGMYKIEGIRDLYCYPEYIMGSNYNLLIYPQSDSTIKSFDYSTLNGKKIGVFSRATAKIERLNKFLSFNKLDCELVYYSDAQAYVNCLDNQEVDLMLGNDVYLEEDYNVAAKFEADPYYLVTSLNRPDLCEQLSAAMNAIYSANPNFADELYQKYFPQDYVNRIDFTAEEKAYLAQSPTLRVAALKENYPLLYQEGGQLKGILPSCLQLITQRTNLNFEYVYGETMTELETLVREGKADLIGMYLNDDQAADQSGWTRTPSYARLDLVVLMNKRTSASASMTMAVPEGITMKPTQPEDKIRFYKTYLDCIRAVNEGRADYVRMPAAFAEDFYSRDYYANINLITLNNDHEEVTLAMPQPADVLLYSIFSKAIHNFSQMEKECLVSQNLLQIRKSAVTIKSLLYSNPLMMLSVCVGGIGLIFAALLVYYRSQMKTRMMRLQLEKAVETGRAKSDFLSRMSHEIRTPMNAIIGLTNLALLSGEATPAIEEKLTKIDASSQFLLSLLNDTLDMSKIENQKMKIEARPLDLSRILKQMQDIFEMQAREKGNQLEFDIALEDTWFIGDELRLSQILTNLLSNACKYTERGRIKLSVAEKRLTDQSGELYFSVKDTGIGIGKAEQEKIFLSFEQADNRNQQTPGTGLGLAISRSLVQLMGGELKVNSKLGAGSDFYFTIKLPLSEAPQVCEPEVPETELDLDGMRILLAEDNDINAEITIQLLELKNVIVERAENGQQALDLFQARPQGYFDLILMDVNMPVKDGMTAVRELRGLDREDARSVLIFAMTANTFQEDREAAVQAGMDDFLPKPFEVDQLYNALRSTLRKR